MTQPRFIHLRTHSEYSLLEGALPLKSLPELARRHDMPALALSDTNNMFAALEFSVLMADAGIQPIIGCQIDLAYTSSGPKDRPPAPAPIVVLAQSEAGYENLMKLNSHLYLRENAHAPHVTLDELAAHSDGLICLSGGPNGPIGRLLRSNQRPAAEMLAARLASIYPERLYIELQRHPGEDGLPPAESLSERGHIEIAYAQDLPLVATNDVYFPTSAMFEAHDALICVAEGAYVDQQEPRRRLTAQHYFKSPAEMMALFADLPEAIENTVEIARRCAFMAYRRDPILPRFADDEVKELRRQANEGLQERLRTIEHAASVQDYQDRLDFELKIIEQMGFPGYFLIVADFIKWTKSQDIPVGPGRGSGAGSLVAYALTITDLDPLRYALLFERFLNPERVSMPDFDIDFCMNRRESVIRYVQKKYGRDRVGQIITFGALLSKAAVRDIGRVLQMPYGQVDRISKLIPTEGVKPVSIEKALADEPRLREEARAEEVVGRLLSYAKQVEGLLRNASTHAAGVVIADRPLDTLVPLYQDPRSDMPATQFNMKWVEQAGLVKFDFLGLKTLTVIQNAVNQIRASGRALHIAADGTELYAPLAGTENDINAIPLDDEATYRLYSAARTVAVFQVESTGMMDALKRMKPTCIEDIVALVALYRPGPMENIPKYCEVKNKISTRELLHPTVDHILDETQGIIVYQEQVMQIAQEMAGYSLGGADLLRRAMGKKIQAAMDAERPKFLKGAAQNGVDEAKAIEVWNLLDKFANYGFNKSHAAAYAVVSYQTAWLKANHPVELMAGAMNCDIHLTDKLCTYLEELRKGLDLPWIPPCVNHSDATFKVVDGALVYALGALKNVGVEAMQLVVQARQAPGPDGAPSGPFAGLFDFARRVDLKRIGKRPLEMMTCAGALDALDDNRARVMHALDALVAYSAAVHEQRASDQVSLFGEDGDDLPEPRLRDARDWSFAQRLAHEHTAVGFYISGHPLDDYMGALRRMQIQTLAEVSERARGLPIFEARMTGVVTAVQFRKSARGNRFAFVGLSDPTGGYEMTVFSEALEAAHDFLTVGANITARVKVESENEQLRFLANSLSPINEADLDATSMGLRISLQDTKALPEIAKILGAGCAADMARPGHAPVKLCMMANAVGSEVDIDLGELYQVSGAARRKIKSLTGVIAADEL